MLLFLVLASMTQQTPEEGRAQRLQKVRPADLHISVNLRGVKPSEAADRTLVPFGLDPECIVRRCRRQTIDLELKESTFWNSIDAFCDRAGLERITTPWHEAVMAGHFCGTGAQDIGFHFVDSGNVRVVVAAHLGAYDGTTYGWFEILPMLPPGSLPIAIRMENLVLRDSRASPIDLKDPSPMLGYRVGADSAYEIRHLSRWPGKISWGRGCHLVPASEAERGPMTLEATLVISYPADLEIKRLPTKEALGSRRWEFSDASIIISNLYERPGLPGLYIDVTCDRSESPETYLLWQEDEKGALLADLMKFTSKERIASLQGSNKGLPETGGFLCVARCLGGKDARFPFRIGGILIPPSRQENEHFPIVPWIGIGSVLLPSIAVLVYWRLKQRASTSSR